MLTIQNNRLYYNSNPFIIVEANSPETRLKQCSRSEQDYLSSIGVNTLYCSCNGAESSGKINPWINNDINQGPDMNKIQQWKEYLFNWVFGYNKPHIVHLLLSEKETHDTFTEAQHKSLIDLLRISFIDLEGYIIWDREEVPVGWSKANSIYSYLKQVDPLNIRGMHNNTAENPWSGFYNSDLIQFLSFQEWEGNFDRRIRDQISRNPNWAGYASEVTGGFQPTDTTKAETLFYSGGNLNSGVGVYIASKDQSAPDFHQQYEQVYKKLYELSTGVITPPQPSSMIIGYSTQSNRSDFKSIPSTLAPGIYYVEARQNSGSVTFTLNKNGTQVLNRTENGAPYDMNGGSTSTATGYNFTAGSYTLTVRDSTGTIVTNFTVGTTTQPVYGCTDPTATNYNPNATVDDGSCIYPPATKPVVNIDLNYNTAEVDVVVKINGIVK